VFYKPVLYYARSPSELLHSHYIREHRQHVRLIGASTDGSVDERIGHHVCWQHGGTFALRIWCTWLNWGLYLMCRRVRSLCWNRRLLLMYTFVYLPSQVSVAWAVCVCVMEWLWWRSMITGLTGCRGAGKLGLGKLGFGKVGRWFLILCGAVNSVETATDSKSQNQNPILNAIIVSKFAYGGRTLQVQVNLITYKN